MDFAETISALFIVVVAAVSLLSNLLVLLCFAHSSEIRRQVPGVFTMNLSLCNILIAVLNMPATLVGIIREQQPFADCVCHTLSFLETFLTANSMLSMAALSIDRWIAVVFPLSYSAKMRYRDALVMVCYSWLHSFTFSLTALLFSWLDYSHVYASCTLQPREGAGDRIRFAVFTVVFHASSFVLSLLTLCFTYLKVLKVARFHCKRIDIITMQTLFLLVDIHPRYITRSAFSLTSVPFSGAERLKVFCCFQCQAEMFGRAKAEKAESHQEDQHLHRLIRHLLCSLCHYKVSLSPKSGKTQPEALLYYTVSSIITNH